MRRDGQLHAAVLLAGPSGLVTVHGNQLTALIAVAVSTFTAAEL